MCRIAHRVIWSAVVPSLAVVSLIAAAPGNVFGQVGDVVKVEEEWELVVGEPDSNSVAPQVTCALSPYGHLDSLHSTFELNSQSLESYSAGGLQLQIWNGETALAARRYPDHQVLATTGETITWTSTMEVVGGQLKFEVEQGDSSTWGSFGGSGHLRHSIDTSLANLNSYSPDVSVANSGVGYAANRVRSLILKRVRVKTSSGDWFEQSTPVTVYPPAE